MKRAMLSLTIGLALCLAPVAVMAIEPPPPVPEGDAPFFGWRAIPAIGVIGHGLVRGKYYRDDNDVQP